MTWASSSSPMASIAFCTSGVMPANKSNWWVVDAGICSMFLAVPDVDAESPRSCLGQRSPTSTQESPCSCLWWRSPTSTQVFARCNYSATLAVSLA
jgi:hypothetical protein